MDSPLAGTTSAGETAKSIWKVYKSNCTALRHAKTQKDRADIFAKVLQFLEEKSHVKCLHRWSGWGLLFLSMLDVVTVDLPASSLRRVNSRKRVLQPYYLATLRDKFQAVHPVEGGTPTLHLDSNGKDTLRKLFEYCVEVIECAPASYEEGNADYQDFAAKMEAHAYGCVNILFRYKVYLAVLDIPNLQKLLEYTIQDLQTHPLKPNYAAKAYALELALSNYVIDLDDWIPDLVSFFLDCFKQTDDQQMPSDLTPTILKAATALITRAKHPVSNHMKWQGSLILRSVVRSWSRATLRLKHAFSEFTLAYLSLYPAPSIHQESTERRQELLKDLKALSSVFMDTKELGHMLPHLTRSSRGASLFTSSHTITSGFKTSRDSSVTFSTQTDGALSFFSCAADIVGLHDRLAVTLVEHPVIHSESPSFSRKRSRSHMNTLLWETLVEHLCGDLVPTTSIKDEVSLSLTSTGRRERERESLNSQLQVYLVLAIFLFERNGQYYLDNRIGDVLLVIKTLTDKLRTQDVHETQVLCLHVLLQIALVSSQEKDACGEEIKEMWGSLWQVLLNSTLPYYRATEKVASGDHDVGQIVICLLNCCLALGLVPSAVAQSTTQELWNLPVFEPKLWEGGGVASVAPIALLNTIMQETALPEEDMEEEDVIMDSLTQESTDDTHRLKLTPLRSKFVKVLMSHMNRCIVLDDAATGPRHESDGLRVLYASTILAMCRTGRPSKTVSSIRIPLPPLVQHLQHRRVSSSQDYVLNGFGVSFCLHEWGLEAQEADKSLLAISSRKDRLPLLLQQYLAEDLLEETSSTRDNQDRKGDLPLHLVDEDENIRPTYRVNRTELPSRLSMSAQCAIKMQTQVLEEMKSMLAKLTDVLCLMKSPLESMWDAIDSCLRIGVVLAMTYRALQASNAEFSIKVLSLMETALATVADHYSPSLLHDAYNSDTAIDRALHSHISFYTIILVLQGKHKVETWAQPTSATIDLTIPSQLRPAIRQIIRAIDKSISLVSDMVTRRGPKRDDGHSSWNASRSTSAEDFLDIERQETSLDRTSERALTLWSFRLLLLLKQENALETVREYASSVNLTPDFLLAIPFMLYRVGSHESTKVACKIVAYAVDEGTCASIDFRDTKDAGKVAALVFYAEALEVLRLASLKADRRKRESGKDPCDELASTAKSVLDVVAASKKTKRAMHMARRVEVEASSAFFVLDLEVFGDFFVDLVQKRLRDHNFIVRSVTGLELKVIFYMYSDAEAQARVWEDLKTFLMPLMPNPTGASDDTSVEYLKAEDPDVSLSLLVSLYTCACASEEMVPKILVVFLDLAKSGLWWYSRHNNCVLQKWLETIGKQYGYDGADDLVNDYLALLFTHHLSDGMAQDSDVNMEDTMSYLQRFPVMELLGETTVRSVLDFLSSQLDQIVFAALYHEAFISNQKDDTFALVEDVARLLLMHKEKRSSGQTPLNVDTAPFVQEQIVSDRFALSFLSLATDDDQLQSKGTSLLEQTKAKASDLGLSSSHIGYALMKMARYTTWGLPNLNERGVVIDGTTWRKAVKAFDSKHEKGIEWEQLNITEMFVQLQVLILSSTHTQRKLRHAIACLAHLIDLTLSVMKDDFVLQRLALHVCFRALEAIPDKHVEAMADIMAIVKQTCSAYLQQVDVFGKNLAYIIQETSTVLFRCSNINALQTSLGDLESVFFSICNNVSSGLDRYLSQVELLPTGVNSGMDKLNSLIRSTCSGREEVKTEDASMSDELDVDAAPRKLAAFVAKQSTSSHNFFEPHHTNRWQTEGVSDSNKLNEIQKSIRRLRSSRIMSKEQYKATLEQVATRLCYMKVEDDRMKEAVADTLGEIGGLDANAFNINPGQDPSMMQTLYRQQFHRDALHSTSTSFVMTMRERLVEMLSSIFFEVPSPPPNVLLQVLCTLREIVTLDAVQSALEKSRDVELKRFVLPFAGASASSWSSFTPSHATSRKLSIPLDEMSHMELWSTSNSLPFNDWVRQISSYLVSKVSDKAMSACSSVATSRTDVAVFLFPYALGYVLHRNSQTSLSAVGKTAEEGIKDMLQSAAEDDGDMPSLQSLQLLIHALNFLRETEKSSFIQLNAKGSKSKMASRPLYGCVVDVDFRNVAAASIAAKMPYSAMQYIEMWLESKHGCVSGDLSRAGASPLDDRVRSILVKAHEEDGSVDGLYGVLDGRTYASQLTMYNHEGMYDKALPLYEAILQTDSNESFMTKEEATIGFQSALRSLGYNHLLRSTTAPSFQLNASQREAVRKMGDWNTLKEAVNDSSNATYSHERILTESLQLLEQRDYTTMLDCTKQAKKDVLASMQTSISGLEATKELYSSLLHLQSIREVEEAAQSLQGRQHVTPISSKLVNSQDDMDEQGSTTLSMIELHERWQQRNRHLMDDFDQLHPVMQLQQTLIQQVTVGEEKNRLLTEHLLSTVSISRKAGRVAIAYRALMQLQQLEAEQSLPITSQIQSTIAKAKLLWDQRETRSALWVAQEVEQDISSKLKNVSREQTKVSLQRLQVSTLTMIGKWLASQRSENSQTILEKYLGRAADLVNSMPHPVVKESPKEAYKAHLALADFMAEMHQQVSTRVKTREWLAGKKLADARVRELEACNRMDDEQQRNNRRHIFVLSKEVERDREERSQVENSVEQFLEGALRAYGRALAFSGTSELAIVFRLISLWFNNQSSEKANDVMEEVLESVPSYKFVPLSYQIISRINTPESSGHLSHFQRILKSLVLKLGRQHPYHTVVQLLALRNSTNVDGRHANEFRANVGDSKSIAAASILDELHSMNVGNLVESMDTLATAYTQLALFDTKEFEKTTRKIPLSKVPIHLSNSTSIESNTSKASRSARSVVSFDKVMRDLTRKSREVGAMPPVLTCHVKPRSDGDYSDVPRVMSFDSTFTVTDTGIHRPKILYCYGSDGNRYKQLVKGRDDTRQDLVIEQAFETVNQFLKEDPNCRRRGLHLCTYKVVPLSPIAGVLEWVEDTIGIGEYLTKSSRGQVSAHERYHPDEWPNSQCRSVLQNAGTTRQKLEAFEEIQRHFTPVFHHFFLEKYPDPATWMHRRKAYIHSTAVVSIVGHILGIGDRHSQNILIHEGSAEVVHIDFGVVFDQGQALMTPETVPFRLTRDIVDAMGVSGTEGTFMRCCEATLQVLRRKRSSMVTILEVFVHDPLYQWTLSPVRALQLQEGEDKRITDMETQDDAQTDAVPGSDAASRALIRIKQKLEGYEDPNGNALSIEGQVKQLISQARDEHNLCRLFPGWAPWL